jgi:hypothetical protein
MSTPKLIDATPFNPMVIKVHYDGFDWESLKPVCEEMITGAKYAVPLEKDGGRSSVYNHYNQPHENKAFSDFYKFLHPIAKHIIFNEWKLAKIFEYRISNSWVNVHKRHGPTSEHNHAASVLVCATYLNMPENGGYIEFKNPLEYHNTFYPYPIDDEISNWKETNQKATHVFSSWSKQAGGIWVGDNAFMLHYSEEAVGLAICTAKERH